MTTKQTVVFDFDGVIHPCKSGWQRIDCIPNEPIGGIRDELKRIHDAGYEIVVVSPRCSEHIGVYAIVDYLEKHSMMKYVDRILHESPVDTVVHITSNSIRFDGQSAGLLEKIQNFKPWYIHEEEQD